MPPVVCVYKKKALQTLLSVSSAVLSSRSTEFAFILDKYGGFYLILKLALISGAEFMQWEHFTPFLRQHTHYNRYCSCSTFYDNLIACNIREKYKNSTRVATKGRYGHAFEFVLNRQYP